MMEQLLILRLYILFVIHVDFVVSTPIGGTCFVIILLQKWEREVNEKQLGGPWKPNSLLVARQSLLRLVSKDAIKIRLPTQNAPPPLHYGFVCLQGGTKHKHLSYYISKIVQRITYFTLQITYFTSLSTGTQLYVQELLKLYNIFFFDLLVLK